MVDETLKELWAIKDDIAREHGYDLDALVAYLRSKPKSSNPDVSQPNNTGNAKHSEQQRGAISGP